MYVATKLDRAWLLNEQRKLYQRSYRETAYVHRKLWGLVTDPRNLRIAFAVVARNKGKRTPGVDGMTVGSVLRDGLDAFLDRIRVQLRTGAYGPSPVRRVLIPKRGKPGQTRPLGIPTITDRVVQAAMKNILEPVFETDFYPVSFGFRPGKSAHGALEYLRMLLRPREAGPEARRRLTYQWAVEGDIKACFDNINHHGLMNRVRRRVADPKVNRLLVAFLKAGVYTKTQVFWSDAGTPQGGILSPLLANIALSVIEERYERHAWPRHKPTTLADPAATTLRANCNRRYDRQCGRPVCVPIRYADDFIILVGVAPGPSQQAQAEVIANQEKAALAQLLQEELSLQLSETKTLVSPVTRPLRFLGHHVRVRVHPTTGNIVSTAVIPKDRSQQLREQVKDMFKNSTTQDSLEKRLKELNPLLRGWSYFYRHAWGAKRVFNRLDHYVWWTILRWIRKKHKPVTVAQTQALYGWRKPGRRSVRWKDGATRVFQMAEVRVEPYRLAWRKPATFAITDGEPGA